VLADAGLAISLDRLKALLNAPKENSQAELSDNGGKSEVIAPLLEEKSAQPAASSSPAREEEEL